MPNVSVSNTPGLYIGSGASAVLNSAQQLYALLSNSGNVNFALINNNTAVQSYFIGTAGGTYSNTNVAAYLPTYTGTLRAPMQTWVHFKHMQITHLAPAALVMPMWPSTCQLIQAH
jgi:hypothetical protein